MDLERIMNKIKRHTPTVLGHEHFTKSAVLLPLVQKDDELHVLFEVRSENMRRQPGEICFPGGRIEAQDKDYLVTAFGMIVYSHAGLIITDEQFDPNPFEVEEIFTVPLSFFLKTKPEIYHVNLNVQPEEKFPFERIPGGENYDWRTSQIDEYFYHYNDKVIWGLTARILSHFVEMIR
jgi:hypothetical protein